MPQLTTRATVHGATVQPLSRDELATAERVANRLHHELRSLLARLPDHARGASALSRHLSLDRATCQRIVSAAAGSRADAHTLTQLPGVQGLGQFLETLERHGLSPNDLAGASAAVDQFRDLLVEVGGSQARLAARLAAAGSVSADGILTQQLRARQALHDAALAITGRRSRVSAAAFIYRPLPDDPERIEGLAISGFIEHVARPDSVPLVFATASAPSNEQGGEASAGRIRGLHDEQPSGRMPRAIVTEFSTSPLPMVTATGPRGLMLQTIDPALADSASPVDIVLANRVSTGSPHPSLEDPPVHETWAMMPFPARWLVFDTLLHRDLARTCIPTADVHLARPGFERNVGSRWTTRFPDSPPLRVHGPGLKGGHCEVYPEWEALLRHVLEDVGWPVDEFLGHRCEIEYPIWQAGYCMSFDFAGPSAN